MTTDEKTKEPNVIEVAKEPSSMVPVERVLEVQKPEEPTEPKGSQIAVSSAEDHMVVFAEDPVGVDLMQQPLVSWFERKIEDEKRQLADLEQSLEIAKNAKHGTAGWKREIAKQKRRIVYYDKGKLALEAGYWMVPAFPADIWAVRTTRKNTPKKEHQWANHVDDIETNSPPAGEGRYVDAIPTTERVRKVVWDTKNETNKEVVRYRASEFDEFPEFPSKLVKPQVVAAATRAMKLKIFDEMGILPERRVRRGDPMIVGKVKRKEGYTEHELNFVICWWIDTKQL